MYKVVYLTFFDTWYRSLYMHTYHVQYLSLEWMNGEMTVAIFFRWNCWNVSTTTTTTMAKKNFNWTISKVCVCWIRLLYIGLTCMSIYLSILWFWIEKKINYHYDDDDIDHHNHQCYILVDRTKQQQKKTKKQTMMVIYVVVVVVVFFWNIHCICILGTTTVNGHCIKKKERSFQFFFSCFTIHLDRQCKLYIIHSRHITIIIIITTIITMIYDG